MARLPPQTATAATVAVPLGPGGSFYGRRGDLFALTCAVGALLCLARVPLRRFA